MSLLGAALALAEAGLAVFPLSPRSKAPAGGHGCKDASHDPAVIRAGWRDAWCNIGIATGYGSDVLVLDVDGEDGERSLGLLQGVYGELPATVTAVTSRGEHRYFRYPGPECEIGNSAGKLGAGLDVRTDGGYVVAPPSIHPSGETYRWAQGKAPGEIGFAPMPDWLIGKLARKHEPAQSYESSDVAYGETAYGRKALEDECAALAKTGEGERNSRLNAVAFRVGQLVARGHLRESALADVHRAGKACGLEDRETRKTVASGFNAGLKKPSSTDPDPTQRKSKRADNGEEPPPPSDADAPTQERAAPPDVELKSAQALAQIALEHMTDRSRRRMPCSGFGKIDQALGGMPPGTMFTVGGRTGSGKSSLLLAMAMNQSSQGLKVGIVSCEDAEWIWGARVLCALNTTLTMDYFFGGAAVDASVIAEARRGVDDARDLGVHMAFRIAEPAKSVAAAVTALVEREQCAVIMVDYLQAFSARGKERYLARTDDAQLIKATCHSKGVPLVLASQLKRPETGNPFREPHNGDLKDSGDIENMSEAIALLWPESDEEHAPCLGKISKVKWSPKRPRFQVQRNEISGALIDLIDAPKKDTQTRKRKERAEVSFGGAGF